MQGKQILVLRDKSQVWGTPGKLTTNKGFICDTLELPWRNNLNGVSCILPDSYSCVPWYSPTLKRTVVRIEDKHGRKDCLCHNGNFAGDVNAGLTTQVHGCTEVGRGYGNILRPDKVLQYGILKSGDTLSALTQHLGEGTHTITYAWGPGCEPQDPRDLNPANQSK